MTILYVSDQEAARAFYESTLQIQPHLHVPGMTEFQLESGFVLGLMPTEGIKRLLGRDIFPEIAPGNPRAELYLTVDNAEEYLGRALQNGAEIILDVTMRDWGDRVGYCLDLDRHVLAFAESQNT
ncbi:MAG: glyoxalase [Candidatus Marinimicrobia bacterium]|nr:glyoxalase [Candidatus Neomarinimicrobiota bacterium]MBT3630627.1 glyoxalase [Candidatus Neomarinimicrobiota bacterium]MBT3825513.1 glyoxalase [Candidatus Neomarinimicrobiota bacterium]MBT4131831.1 glyoxalase [Candidatus Neomarinimicrobiota bacterium]MBT4295595.1 glyoxalase [Candidatus Neomarinimicrobiota bacterium]